MPDAGEVLQQFYAAVVKRHLSAGRAYLKDDLLFKGLFETYRGPDEYLSALTQLLGITVRLDVKKIVARGNDAVILFELETKAPAAATTLVTEWHEVEDGKIARVQSVFDGRPFAAMFTPPPDHAQDEQAIRALNDTFGKALLTRDAKLRASIWTEDGSVAPPTGGLFRGRQAMEKHFESEAPSVTNTSRIAFSNYRFRFLSPDAAFVETEIELNDVLGPDGKLHAVVPISVVFTAVRQDGAWFVQDERTHFLPLP